jgi:hypothetical protein
MKQTRLVLAAFLAAVLLAPTAVPSAITCVEMPPLKPVHRICGVVFFGNGERTRNATVSVLHEDKEIAVQKTDDNGNFAFDQLKSGKYELRFVSLRAFRVWRVPRWCLPVPTQNPHRK